MPELDKSMKERLSDELLRSLARLSFSGAAIYPILFVIIYFSTSIDFSALAICGFLVVLPAAVGRVITARQVLRSPAPSSEKFSLYFWSTILSSAIGWALFSASTIQDEGATTWNAMFLLLITSGLAAGGASSLAADNSLARVFIFVLWFSHVSVFLFQSDFATSLIITLYGFYLVAQVQRQNRNLVTSILDRAKLEQQATDLKAANLESNRARETAEKALHLAEEAKRVAEDASLAKSRFLATISHEIRTPLHGVLGMNTLLLDSELAPEQREYAETIGQSGEALLSIINEVLDFSKLEAGREELQTSDFHVSSVIKQAGEIVHQAAKDKGLSFEIAVDDSVDEVLHGDPARLRQVVLNLLTNAIKFTDIGGVRVDARLLEEEADRVWAEVRVSDTGIGIAEDDQERLFEPFLQVNDTTTRTRGGSGLGLAISKQLTDLMGGTLELDSVPGEGSTFILQLPFTKPDPDGKAEVSTSLTRLASAENSGHRVLVVEDNVTNQKILERLLIRAGYGCSVVENGKRAVELSEKEAFDLILMDCHMPEMDGYDAARSIIDNLGEKAPPIVAVTANASVEDRKKCRESGMVDFLGKPVRLHLLQKVLDTYIPR